MRKEAIFSALAVLAFTMLLIAMLYKNPGIVGFVVYESQPGPEGKDTYIREDFPNNNLGTSKVIEIGKTAGGKDLRGLIEFDLSSIPETETIVSAIIQLHLNASSNSNTTTIIAYRVTKDWSETGSSWNNATTSSLWSSAGGDYTEQEGYIIVTNETKWYNLTITSLVRSWINQTYNNYGILLLSNDSLNGYYKDIDSSDSAANLAPIITIDHTENAVPVISSISTDSSLSIPKQVGENVAFTISWTDLEGNNAQAFICNSSSINTTGCAGRTFCAASLSASPSLCAYTVLNSDNRTSPFYVAVCDANCSEINSSYFYVNHASNITLIQPNGGETLNQSQGNYLVKFNVSDIDSDLLTASLYYGLTQNSTTNTIALNLNLTQYCTDADSNTATTNNCTYSWNTTGIFGTYFMTTIINDTFSNSTDTSSSSFNVRSIIDSEPPQILSNWIDSYIYSGKTTSVYANITDNNIITAWVSFNYTNVNATMSNSSQVYNASFTAPAVGKYKYKIYAQDPVGNLNNSVPWQEFNVSKPTASTQNESYPPQSLPYHTIKITSSLNASDSLKDVYSYLNVPDGFTFLSDYSQNSYLGNFTSNQTKTATWFVSVPLTEGTYTLNVTHTDKYGNSWNSTNFYTQVTSVLGGGGYNLELEGYPYVTRGENYTVKSYFTQNGNYAQPDSITVTMIDSIGSKLSDHPALMNNLSTGIFNYSRKIDTTWLEGQWETIINATKSGTSYYTHQFWRVTGTLFDVRNVTVTNPSTEALSISFILENKGTKSEDMNLFYNLTKESTGEQLGIYSETVGVSAGEAKQWSVTGKSNPSTGLNTKGYVGQVRITITGNYPGGKAGAYQVFSTTSGNVSAPVTPSGGGGGGRVTAEKKAEKADFEIIADEIISLAKNLQRIASLIVSNTGDKELTNISLSLADIDSNQYSVSPAKIDSIKPGKTAEFKIYFFITNYTGEKIFFYKVKSNELEKTKQATLQVLGMKEFFLKELLKLQERTSALKERNIPEILPDIKTCENIIEKLKIDVENEEFINAKLKLEDADKCINDIETKSKTVSAKPSLEKIAWIAAIILIMIFLIALVIIAYIIYRKLKLTEFIRSEKPEKPEKPEKTKIKREYINQRLEDIEKKLNIKKTEDKSAAETNSEKPS